MNNDIDDLLKQALTPTEEPDFWVNQKIINSMNQKGNQTMKKFKKIIVGAMLVMALRFNLCSLCWRNNSLCCLSLFITCHSSKKNG